MCAGLPASVSGRAAGSYVDHRRRGFVPTALDDEERRGAGEERARDEEGPVSSYPAPLRRCVYGRHGRLRRGAERSGGGACRGVAIRGAGNPSKVSGATTLAAFVP